MKQYWAVKWGETIRMSDPIENPCAACKNCYGVICEGMMVIPLGNKAQARKAVHSDLSKRTDWATVHKVIPSTPTPTLTTVQFIKR